MSGGGSAVVATAHTLLVRSAATGLLVGAVARRSVARGGPRAGGAGVTKAVESAALEETRHCRMLPRPLELQRRHLAPEAVHEAEHLPRPAHSSFARAAFYLAIVLSQSLLRLIGEADIGPAGGVAEEVDAEDGLLSRHFAQLKS